MEQKRRMPSFFQLFTPLEGELYEKNESGIRTPDSIYLTSYETVDYAGYVRQEISRMNLAGLGPKGLSGFLQDKGVKARVFSMIPGAESYGGRLWGVLEVLTFGRLSSADMRVLREEWEKQEKEGWGSILAQRKIPVPDGELSVSFPHDGQDFVMLMEQELKGRPKSLPVQVIAEAYMGRKGYRGAEVRLPATRYEMEDALHHAHVREDGGYELRLSGGWPEFLRSAVADMEAPGLEELNLLAYKISRMDEVQLGTYEGIVKLRQDADIDHSMSMKELINAAYNLNCFEFHPGIANDHDLGEFCMQGEMLDLISGLPDEVFELLDEEKVGAALRRSDQGTYAAGGYVLRSAPDGPEVYDGSCLSEQLDAHDGLISLRLESAGSDEGQNSGIWLELPAEEKAMQWALRSLGEASFDSCMIAEVKGILPVLEYQLAGDEDIGKMNTLAERIAGFPDSRTLMKYKAILELEACNDLDMELDIAANLNCYDYDYKIISPESYAEYLLQEAGFDTDDPAFSGFDFRGYGERRLESNGYTVTAYGAVARNDLPFVQEYTKTFQQGMSLQ